MPTDVTNALWEGSLELPPDLNTHRLRNVRGGATSEVALPNPRQLPHASVGRPETWRLQDVYRRAEMPATLISKLDEADFYLVRFSCSFRPRSDDTSIEWARFVVSLLADDGEAEQPTVADLHPMEVHHEIKRQSRVSLSPTLHFYNVEASLGEAAFELEYAELQPIVTAAGAGESTADWSYNEAKGLKIRGSKWMHMLVRSPKSSDSCTAKIDLVGDLMHHGWRIPVARPRRVHERVDQLVVRLW
ncbi:MAG TPA: hypothetical protein VGB75_11705 [Jatrophihabitans sp.]|uniref:hypothetical protein n=1 Tax=Jatrophihabitans sp. TaxID=1932789 RepID=UPI002EE082C2